MWYIWEPECTQPLNSKAVMQALVGSKNMGNAKGWKHHLLQEQRAPATLTIALNYQGTDNHIDFMINEISIIYSLKRQVFYLNYLKDGSTP